MGCGPVFGGGRRDRFVSSIGQKIRISKGTSGIRAIPLLSSSVSLPIWASSLALVANAFYGWRREGEMDADCHFLISGRQSDARPRLFTFCAFWTLLFMGHAS